MSRGIVIFAQNNPQVDYIKLAVFAAKQAQKHLDLPVSLITDSRSWLEQNYPDHPFDHVIDVDFNEVSQHRVFYDGALASKKVDWRNHTRSKIYDLTPYYTTLVIDSDYIINSDILKQAFSRDADLQIYSNSMDLAVWRNTEEFARINPYSVKFYWATAFVFQKNTVTESFFYLVNYIKSNWKYFRMLYNIDTTLFRNDYAFSIAIHLMNNKTQGSFSVELPGTMIYVKDRDILVGTHCNKMKFLLEKENHPGEYTLAKTTGLDVHVMNKISLARYIDGGSGV
jgi:hypothetical protein